MFVFYRLLRTTWPYIGPLLGLYSVLNGVGVTIPEALQLGATHILRLNLLWFVAASFFFFTAFIEIRHRGKPLTALETRVRLAYADPEGREVHVTRTQTLRANREDVTGYIRKAWAEGEISKTDVECTISHNPSKGQEQVECSWSPGGVEIIHRFPPIPMDPLRLGTNTVQRTDNVVYKNSFMGRDEWYEIEIPVHYQHHRLSVTIAFHPKRTCGVRDCKAIRISAHGVTPLTVMHTDETNAVCVNAKGVVGGERFRIYWTFPQTLQN
jgi:hypothetical protein